MPVLHLCSVSGVCSFDVPGRVVLHCSCWRLRNRFTANESWFVQTGAERAGGLVCQPASFQTPQEDQRMQTTICHRGSRNDARLQRDQSQTSKPWVARRWQQRCQASEESLEGIAKKRKSTSAAEELQQRVAAHSQEVLKKQRKAKNKDKKRKRRRSSIFTSSTEEFKLGEKVELTKIAEDRPGFLAKEALKKMERYLASKVEAGADSQVALRMTPKNDPNNDPKE
eukprot:5464807-Amphidinium_carterae.1